MSVTILAPTSRVIPRGLTRITWSSSYPQSAYEILYKEVDSIAWQTFGRVTSTLQTVDLDVAPLIDFKEYLFRVVVYSSNESSGVSIYNGSDKSLAYSIIVTPKYKIADMRARYGDKMVEVPVYSETNADNSTRVALGNNKVGVVPIVLTNTAVASEHHLSHPMGNRAFADNDPVHYTPNYVPRETYIRRDDRNTHYSYYQSVKYDRTYQVGYYISSYNANYAPYYRGTYVSGYVAQYNATYFRGYYRSYFYAVWDLYYTSTISGYNVTAKYDSYTYSGTSCYKKWGDYFYCCGYNYISTGEAKCGCNHYPEYYCYYGSKQGYYFTGSYYQVPYYQSTPKYLYYMSGYSRYYGYYRYTSPSYSAYYGYYLYQVPNYSLYYNYYRYYAYYKHTYYTYTTTYHYA